MTTPTDFQRWHSEAMRLADEYVTAGCVHSAPNLGRNLAAFLRTSNAMTVARAALSAHLLAVPMGEPVAYLTRGQDLQPVNAEGLVFSDWAPLFTKPEGMA